MKKAGIVLLLLGVIAGGAFFFYTKKKPVQYTAPVVAIDTTDPRLEQIYASLDTYFTNRNLQNGFSGSVLISLKGKPVYEKCFGYCDFRNKDLLADTNSFQLASVSKTYTATAMLWCVEQGLLSLDDSLQKFFPQLSFYKGIQVKHLLCHRSGLPNYLYFCSGKCNKGEYLTNSQVIDLMARTRPAPYAKADKKFEYCNTNYLLLASIIEQVTEKKFHDFMRETFFAPLGMTHTFIYDYTDSSDRKIAISYNSKWEIQRNDCFDGVVGDKGCYSTVRDMFLWDMAFYEGKLLSQEMLKEAYAPRSFEKPGKRNYGYGWRLMQQPDSSYLVYHNGWWHGNNTVFFRNVRDTSAIIILSNKFNRSVYRIQPVFDILYGRKSGETEEGEE
ncbi:MAG TPA: serine hydrolase domain-containing protein [Chitinophagales bacterium]|nr:serine hydrolase domain-containing protein [Chitinophagales bacterium]